jgi:hypothetical protein
VGGRRKREFALFFLSCSALLLFRALFFFALSRSFLLRARKREKSAGALFWIPSQGIVWNLFMKNKKSKYLAGLSLLNAL